MDLDNIEKEIKRCEELIKPEHANWIGISNQLAIAGLLHRIKETDNDLTTVYSKGYEDCRQKYMQKVKDKIEELKDTAKRIAGAYQYADSIEDLWEKKSRVIELRSKAEILEELLEDK